MNRGIALVVVAVVLVGVAGIAAAGPVGTAVAQEDPTATNETDEGNETANGTDISPGERLSGVIGVQRAEISGEVESRSFEVALNRTETPEERADVVAERLNGTEERLAAIERRQRELRERRDAGELTRGEFAARMAETSARAETVKREANRSADVARELPAAARESRGLDEGRLTELRERAGEASGPEVAAIARGVAGNDVGGPLAADRRGPPDGARPGDGPGRGDGADAGGGSDAGDGPGSDGTPGAGDGPPDRGNETDRAGNATNATGDSSNAVGTPIDDENGANASDGADRGPGAGGGNATPPDDDPSPPVDGGAGDGSDAAPGGGPGNDAANAVGALAERLAGPLTAGSDLVRRVFGGIDG
ncbi:hypothetical protein CK500_07590 [Halorubrum salipaludis]|uniref:Uncharacterized protein n=1 Tax=Halorubrum salipaludis TaxID=2032630 RepID=A0A2A2FIA6_9EURY|nr:hypothetical protein [Halorubrum salipaludis]PAU84283.1 hypothetical protein CK500_07590 [Halorubrum salipaludis]